MPNDQENSPDQAYQPLASTETEPNTVNITTTSEEPLPTKPTSHEMTPPAKRTSGTASYLVAVLAGIVLIGTGTYLFGSTLRSFLINDSSDFFFDLSVIDLYSLIMLGVFTIIYSVAMFHVERGRNEIHELGKRHELIGAIWQTILIIIGAGAVVGIIYAPLDAILFQDDQSDAGLFVMINVLASVFTLLLAGLFWLKDRWLHAKKSTRIPTIILAVCLLGVAIGSTVMVMQPKPSSASDYYDTDYEEDSFSRLYDEEQEDPDDASYAAAMSLADYAQAVHTITSSYPKTLDELITTYEKEMNPIDTITKQQFSNRELIGDAKAAYRYCSPNGAQIIYLEYGEEVIHPLSFAPDIKC